MLTITRYKAAKLTGVTEAVFSRMWKRQQANEFDYEFFTEDGQIKAEHSAFTSKYSDRIKLDVLEKIKNPKVKAPPKIKPVAKKMAVKEKSQSQILLESVEESVLAVIPNGEGYLNKIKSEIFKKYKEKLETFPIKKTKIPYHKMSKLLKAQYGLIDDIEDIGFPTKEGEQIRVISKKSFNAISFLIFIIEKIGVVDECIMSYSSTGIKAVNIIENFISTGSIKKYHFQSSTLRQYKKDADVLEIVKGMIDRFGSNVVTGDLAYTHAKILLCRVGKDFYCVEGSGNISENAKIEQYLIEKSEESFNFHKKWIMNVKDFSAEGHYVKL